MIAWMLVACGTSQAPALEEGVRAWLVGGEVVVQIVDDDFTGEVPPPTSPALTFEPVSDTRTESAGGVTIATRQFSYEGGAGFHTLTAPRIDGLPDPETLYLEVDVDTPPPREALVDIDEPERVRSYSWLLWVAGLLVAMLAGATALTARLVRGDTKAPARIDPPDVVALRDWATAKSDASLSDLDRAAAVSRIFRTYAEDALRFPAASGTTPEVLEALSAIRNLDEANLPRAKRLLRATDLMKFAEADATEALFTDLDSDLKGFVESTRPRRMDAS